MNTVKPKKVAMLRDLGGIVCRDGRKVVSGKLFRSSHLAKADRNDEFFGESGIGHIVDLRSDSELLDKPYEAPDGIKYHRFTPLDDTLNPAVTSKTRNAILERNMAKEGGTLGHLSGIYRTMITLPAAHEAFKKYFELILDTDKGVMWHCTQGKDRTGMVSALTLLALGAERDVIMADYMRYNASCRFVNSMIFLGVTLAKFSVHTAKQLDNLMSAREAYLQAAFEEIDAAYGGTEAFLRDALGLDDAKLEKLREKYLI